MEVAFSNENVLVWTGDFKNADMSIKNLSYDIGPRITLCLAILRFEAFCVLAWMGENGATFSVK